MGGPVARDTPFIVDFLLSRVYVTIFVDLTKDVGHKHPTRMSRFGSGTYSYLYGCGDQECS